MEIKEIEVLAEKARIKMSQNELGDMVKDFDHILEYISQINSVNLDDIEDENLDIKNVYREDFVTNESGSFTDKILKEIPETESNYLKVRKIL